LINESGGDFLPLLLNFLLLTPEQEALSLPPRWNRGRLCQFGL